MAHALFQLATALPRLDGDAKIALRGSNREAVAGRRSIGFPVIVKPVREDASIGIHFGAVCQSIKELMERIDYIHAEFDTPALIEEYIEGRELYMCWR